MKKKQKIKALQLQGDCLCAVLAEYVIKEAIRRVPIPNYAKKAKGDLFDVSDYENEKAIHSEGRFLGMIPFQYLSEQQKQAKEQ